MRVLAAKRFDQRGDHMTLGVAWIGQRHGGSDHLYFASDSRVTGGRRLDACPKILTLPRSDCALCFAGDTSATYPLMIQMSYAIAAHQPARERSLDIARAKDHLVRLSTDLIGRFEDLACAWKTNDVQFLFGGFSWLKQDFRLWTISYREKERTFAAREATIFRPNLRKAAFIGDWAKAYRSLLYAEISSSERTVDLEPLTVLSKLLLNADREGTIGGPPQLARIAQHMNTRPICIKWKGEDTLFGRPLFDYENIDYWSLDPMTGQVHEPRKFGHRDE